MKRTAALVVVLCALAAAVTALLTLSFNVLPGAVPHVDVGRDFTAAQVAREVAFHSALRPWSYAALAVSVLFAGALGLSHWGARLVQGLPGRWAVKVVLATVLLLALGQLVTLPFNIRVELVLREYGLSTQDWAGWTNDVLRGLAIEAVTSSLALLGLITLARKAKATWWAWGALAGATLVVVGSFAYPVVVEPAFNSFTKLPAGELRTDLLALAKKDGVSVQDVLVADASKRTTALNAYVSGIGSTRRIVVYDTLVRQASPREVELVVAHELGHAKRQDVLHGTIIGAFGAAAGVAALFLLLSWSPLLRRSGAAGAHDPRIVPLVLFLAVLSPLLLSPLTNVVSRRVEARADVHSLELTGDPATFISSEKRLSVTNLSDLAPSFAAYLLFYTHPTGPERIALAREWERLHR